MRVRQGNDFIFLWAIERNGEPEDLSNAVNIKLHFKNFDRVSEVKSFQIVDGNIVRVEVSPEWASRLGAYSLILSYAFEDESLADNDRKCVVDVLAFNIVSKTSEADDITEMAKTTDIMIGLKGDKGDPFTYEDFTPEQIEDLQRPAIEAAESVQIVENQVTLNEAVRVQAETERETAETTRVSNENSRVTAEQKRVNAESLRVTAESSRELAESLRVEAELLRQSNTQEAISNAEEATLNANTAAQNADDARLAIQDDLALKANHGYVLGEEETKTLKQVETDTSIKIENVLIGGSFEDDSNGDGIADGGIVIVSPNPNRDTIHLLTNDCIIGSKAQKFVGGVGGGLPFLKLKDVDSATDKYYYSFWTKSTVAGGFWRVSNGNNRVNIPTSQNVYRRDSIVLNNTVILSVNMAFYSTLAFDPLPEGEEVYIDGLMQINLTKIFGVGNEPTKEEFELLLDILGIDYFEGEITIPAQKIMQWQLKLKSQLADEIVKRSGLIYEYVHSDNIEIRGFTVDLETGTFTKASHGLSNGDALRVCLNQDTTTLYLKEVTFAEYVNTASMTRYVVNATDDTFQLSRTPGGVVETLTAVAGTDLTKWHFEKRTSGGTTDRIVFEGLNALSGNAKNIRIVVTGKIANNGTSGHLYFNIDDSIANTNYIAYLGSGEATRRSTYTLLRADAFGTIEYDCTYNGNNLVIRKNLLMIREQNLTAYTENQLFYRNSTGYTVDRVAFTYCGFTNGLTIQIYKQ